MQKVLLNDIVQFRLIEIDNKKIPILVDEATPHQREEYHGVDPLVTVTGTLVIRQKLAFLNFFSIFFNIRILAQYIVNSTIIQYTGVLNWLLSFSEISQFLEQILIDHKVVDL